MEYHAVFPVFILVILLNLNNKFTMAHIASITSNCTVLRDVFAEATSRFALCAVYNSRPITLCENCVNSYISVLESYQNMSEYTDNETKCIDYFINLDRLQIVETLYMNSLNLWNDAKCYECFEIANGTLTPNISKKTKEFNKFHEKLMTCLNRTDINNQTLCPKCMDSYVDLNLYYLSISNANEEIGVCMDIVDLMNNTWTFWSVQCCKYRRHNEYIFLGTTVGVFVITLLFYVIAQCCVERKFPTIIQQTRFGGSVNNCNQLG